MNLNANLDGHKIHLHPDKVAQWKETGDCYPIHVEIGITGRCNHNCKFCALDFVNNKKDIDSQVMLDALKDMGAKGVRSVMFGGEGEPTLHPSLGIFVQKSKQFGLDVAITTNGTLFKDKLQKDSLPYLSWIKFSVDAGTPEDYKKIHGVKTEYFRDLIKNISDSVDYKKKNNLDVTIGTQLLVIPDSLNSVKEAINILKDTGADYLSIKPYSHHPRSKNNLIVDPKEYNRLERLLDNLDTGNLKVVFRKATLSRILEGNNYPECYGLSFISLIDSNGEVLPCNLFYNQSEFSYGNLYENSFEEIWEGERRKKVLEKLRKKGVKECRVGCRCDAGNRYLHRIKNPENHDNFT